jgi:hypothetical protein
MQGGQQDGIPGDTLPSLEMVKSSSELAAEPPHLPSDFEAFWRLYPRRMAKVDALKAWGQISADERIEAYKSLPVHIAYWRSLDTLPQYLPLPATWLRGRRFLDELPALESLATKQESWWASEAATMRKGGELGVAPRPGEDMQAYRGRIKQAIVGR